MSLVNHFLYQGLQMSQTKWVTVVLMLSATGCGEPKRQDDVSPPVAEPKLEAVNASSPPKSSSTSPSSPMPPAQPKKPQTEKETLSDFLTTYLRTPDLMRSQLVVDPKEYDAGKMEYHKSHRELPDATAVVKEIKPGPKTGYLTVIARTKMLTGGKVTDDLVTWYVKKTDNGYLVDWSALTGFNAVSYLDWPRNRNRAPPTFRLEAKLGDFYFDRYFMKQNTFLCVSCTERFANYQAQFYAFILRDSEPGKRVFDVLSDGKSHRVTLTLDRIRGPNDKIVDLKEMVSDTWVK